MKRYSLLGQGRLLPCLLTVMAGLLCLYGCGSSLSTSDAPPTLISTSATPTVDIAHTRQAFLDGGELTYWEVMALRQNVVGKGPLQTNFSDNAAYQAAYDKFLSKWQDFDQQLARCRLKQTTGWVEYSWPSRDKDRKIIPDRADVYVYLGNPYAGPGESTSTYEAMYLSALGKGQVAAMKYGHRIDFSGQLAEVNGVVSVNNADYELLEDEAAGIVIPTPTGEELSNLRVVLERGRCYGTCPAYTLTITSDGKVTFEGKRFTKVKGPAAAMLDKAQLAEIVREVKKADFFNLDHNFLQPANPDSPTDTLTVQMGSSSRSVTGEDGATARRLTLLAGRIDQITNSEQWVSCGPEGCHDGWGVKATETTPVPPQAGQPPPSVPTTLPLKPQVPQIQQIPPVPTDPSVGAVPTTVPTGESVPKTSTP